MNTYTHEQFVNDSAVGPYIDADYLNGLTDALSSLTSAVEEPVAYNATGSTASNYNLATARTTTPSSDNLPLVFTFTPSVSNNAGAKVTPQWGTPAATVQYDIMDMSTGLQITANQIKANRPCQLLFDGTYAWFNGNSAYLQYGATSNLDGYFDKSNTKPTGTTRLNYSGDFYATRVYSAVYNPTSADIAEGYPVHGEWCVGDLVSVNSNGEFIVNSIECNTKVVGIISSPEQYGILFGEAYGTVPIAAAGRVVANVVGDIHAGDYLAASSFRGHLKSVDIATAKRGSVVAMALENSECVGDGKVLVQIVRM